MFSLKTVVLIAFSMICSFVYSDSRLVYFNDFEDGFGDIRFHKKCREEQYQVIYDADRNSNVIRYFQRGATGCFEGSSERMRTQAWIGPSVDLRENFDARAPKLRILPGKNTWIGFAFKVDPSTPDNSKRWFLLGSEIGEPVLLIRGNDTLNVMPERYRIIRDGKVASKMIENYVSDHPILKGAWNTVVVHWYRRFEYQKDGIYKVWLNGEKVVDLNGIVTGSDSYALGKDSPTPNTGIYFGTEKRSGDYTLFVDDIRVAIGDGDLRSLVDPLKLKRPAPSATSLEVQ